MPQFRCLDGDYIFDEDKHIMLSKNGCLYDSENKYWVFVDDSLVLYFVYNENNDTYYRTYDKNKLNILFLKIDNKKRVREEDTQTQNKKMKY